MVLSVASNRWKPETPHSTGRSAGGTQLRAAPPAHDSKARGSPNFADSRPQKGPFGPLGVLGPRPPRAGFGTRAHFDQTPK
eukprot:11481493-Alexandrium_andersonii.AAC.1